MCVINNGRWFRFFKQTHEVHQESALLGPLFLYMAEIFAINMRNNSEIKGIKLSEGVTGVVTQCTDGTNVWSLCGSNSVNAAIDELEEFHQSSGLKVNYKKSCIYRVGTIHKDNCKLKLNKPLSWKNGVVGALSLLINVQDLQDLKEMNFSAVLEKISNTKATWSFCKLTVFAKIEVVNSLVGSLFVYKMQTLPSTSDELSSTITTMITKFIWNGRKPKIHNSILTRDKIDGGRKLVNVKLCNISLKTEWVKRMYRYDDPVLNFST